MNRKQFITKSISFSLLIAFHREAQACASLTKSKTTNEDTSVRFPKITLYTSKLDAMYTYYSETLGWTVENKQETQFTVQLGQSILTFKAVDDGSNPLYHYAINIPSNKMESAQKWLSDRTELLGGGVFYFDFWDAHAIYFKDPAGNIGELIARHTLDNDKEGDFGLSDLLYISEIGVPVDSPSDFAKELKTAYDLDIFGETMFVGDENGLFVIPPVDRPWFPENEVEAAVYPTEIYISDKGEDEFNYKDYPYQIKRKD